MACIGEEFRRIDALSGNRLDPRSTGLTAIKDAQVSEAAFFACVLFRSPLHCGACKMF
jgi:hypothetical protein